jgi:hypothetical protein
MGNPLMARIYELNPLTCLNCGTTMLINAFITDPFEIQRLLKNVAIPHYRAPPPLPSRLLIRGKVRGEYSTEAMA